MLQTYRAEAVVLKRQPWRERDSRVLLYTREHGLLDLVARGTLRPESKLAGHIEPFSRIKLMVARGRQYDYLAGAAGQEVYPGLKSDYAALLAAGAASRRVLKLIKGGIADARIYGLLIEYYRAMSQDSEAIEPDLLSAAFDLKLLSLLGYRPVLSACALCSSGRSEELVVFSAAAGGVLCKKCANNRSNLTKGQETIKIIRFLLDSDFALIIKQSNKPRPQKEAVAAIRSFTDYQTG